MIEVATTSGFERNQPTRQLRSAIEVATTSGFERNQPTHQLRRFSAVDLPPAFDCSLFTPVRLYGLAPKDKEIVANLVDLQAGYDEILCILELEDESFELGVLREYIPELKKFLDKTFIQYSVDWKYRPFDPSVQDLQSFCASHPELSDDHIRARIRMMDLFLRRADTMIKDGWPMQKCWYAHLVELVPK